MSAGGPPGPAGGGGDADGDADAGGDEAGSAGERAARPPSHGYPPDFTSFYQANEQAAREVRRLLDEGALDRLVTILRSAGARLEIESFSPALRQAEYLGHIEPGAGEGEEAYPYEDFLADRVEQWIELEGGRRTRVVMPDHICPVCGNTDDNFIVETKKTCAACRFQW